MKKENQTKTVTKTEIIIAMFILLFAIDPFLDIATNISIIELPYYCYTKIRERYFLSGEEIAQRALRKVIKDVKFLEWAVVKYFYDKKCFIYKSEDIENMIKYVKSTKNNPKFDAKAEEAIYDPYGNRYFYDTYKYEIYCNNTSFFNLISGLNKEKYKVKIKDLRIDRDINIIIEMIGDYYRENKKYPTDIGAFYDDLPSKKLGIQYELDSKNYEVVCSENGKRYKYR